MNSIKCAVVILAALNGSEQINPHFLPASEAERQSRMDALSAAYKAMDERFLDTQGKVIVLKEVNGLLLVSFLKPEDERSYGGDAHVTYDLSERRVTDVEYEE